MVVRLEQHAENTTESRRQEEAEDFPRAGKNISKKETCHLNARLDIAEILHSYIVWACATMQTLLFDCGNPTVFEVYKGTLLCQGLLTYPGALLGTCSLALGSCPFACTEAGCPASSIAAIYCPPLYPRDSARQRNNHYGPGISAFF